MTEFADRIDFDPDTGLVPAVVQDAADGRVLMLAYMNAEALRRTLEEGRVTFWSRSRDQLWRKGDTSGNWLEAVEVRVDCDADALLVRARPHGPACHTGAESCFDAGPMESAAPAEGAKPDGDDGGEPGAGPAPAPPRLGVERPSGAGEPGLGDGGAGDAAPSPAPVLASVLEEVVRVVAERDEERPDGSHTVRLLEGGPAGPARKVGEEALEVVMAALEEPDRLRRLAEESADLLYHLVVLWRAAGLDPDGVGGILAERRSGDEG